MLSHLMGEPSAQPPTDSVQKEESANGSEENKESGPSRTESEEEDTFQDASAEFDPEFLESEDWEDDPLETRGSKDQPTEWNHAFFSQFVPRNSSSPDDSTIRKQMRDLLGEIEAGPPELGDEELEGYLSEWLRSVDEKVHPVLEFVAGSFGRHVAAWEELLANSSRPASRSVLSWIRSGIKPTFAGTEKCDPKKLERVKRMLRKVVGQAKVDEWLSGQVPHPVDFPNHRSFFENSDFGVKAVGEMLVNSTVKLYAADERKPKVINPLGVANLPKGRLVLDGGYVNSFTKHVPFKYFTRDPLISRRARLLLDLGFQSGVLSRVDSPPLSDLLWVPDW